jgi:hypothetical protein
VWFGVVVCGDVYVVWCAGVVVMCAFSVVMRGVHMCSCNAVMLYVLYDGVEVMFILWSSTLDVAVSCVCVCVCVCVFVCVCA